MEQPEPAPAYASLSLSSFAFGKQTELALNLCRGRKSRRVQRTGDGRIILWPECAGISFFKKKYFGLNVSYADKVIISHLLEWLEHDIVFKITNLC